MGLPERFALEAQARPPNIKPNADEVYAALSSVLTIKDKKQHLASPFGAR